MVVATGGPRRRTCSIPGRVTVTSDRCDVLSQLARCSAASLGTLTKHEQSPACKAVLLVPPSRCSRTLPRSLTFWLVQVSPISSHSAPSSSGAGPGQDKPYRVNHHSENVVSCQASRHATSWSSLRGWTQSCGFSLQPGRDRGSLGCPAGLCVIRSGAPSLPSPQVPSSASLLKGSPVSATRVPSGTALHRSPSPLPVWGALCESE